MKSDCRHLTRTQQERYDALYYGSGLSHDECNRLLLTVQDMTLDEVRAYAAQQRSPEYLRYMGDEVLRAYALARAGYRFFPGFSA